jgi:hypothetical protein
MQKRQLWEIARLSSSTRTIGLAGFAVGLARVRRGARQSASGVVVQKSGIHSALQPADLDRATGGERWCSYLKCCTKAMPISPSTEMIANTRPYLETSTMTLSPQSAMRPATIAK